MHGWRMWTVYDTQYSHKLDKYYILYITVYLQKNSVGLIKQEVKATGLDVPGKHCLCACSVECVQTENGVIQSAQFALHS